MLPKTGVYAYLTWIVCFIKNSDKPDNLLRDAESTFATILSQTL